MKENWPRIHVSGKSSEVDAPDWGVVLFPDPVPFSVVWMESRVVDLGEDGELVGELDEVELDAVELNEAELDEAELLLGDVTLDVDVGDADDLVGCGAMVDVGGLADNEVVDGRVVCKGRVKLEI